MPAAAHQPASHKWNHTLWLTAMLLVGLLVMSRSKADPDLWGHVQYGKEVLRDGHLHNTTTWSYAVQDYRWINHENIAELMLAAADLAAGQSGLLLLRSALTLLLLGLPLWSARRSGAGLATCGVLVLIVSLGTSFHWLIRPHMLSYVSAAALFGLLFLGAPGVFLSPDPSSPSDSGQPNALWAIPFLMCFWTNAHGGYLAGMAILMAWLGLDCLDRLWRRDATLRKCAARHSAVILASIGACFVNPYGAQLHLWMLSSLGQPRPEISEWAPLPLFTADGLAFWMILGLSLLCWLRSELPFRWPGAVLLTLLSWQALSHHRHLPFVAIAAAFILAPHIESLMQQLAAHLQQRSRTTVQNPGSQGRSSLLLSGSLVVLLTFAQYPQQSRLHVDRSFYPVDALQFMADHQLDGRVLVTFNWAQYALAAFADGTPESRVAIDGRFRTCYPQEVIDVYFDFILGEHPQSGRSRSESSAPFDAQRALDLADPQLVLLERSRHPHATHVMRNQPDWCLLYQDSVAELWGRRSIYDDLDSDQRLPESLRQLDNVAREGSVAWPAFPTQNTPVML